MAGTEAITLGPAVTLEARADALRRDQQRIADEKRAAARPQEPGPIPLLPVDRTGPGRSAADPILQDEEADALLRISVSDAAMRAESV